MSHKTFKNAEVRVAATPGELGLRNFTFKVVIDCPVCQRQKTAMFMHDQPACINCYNAFCKECSLELLTRTDGRCPICRYEWIRRLNEQGFPSDDDIIALE